MMMSMNEKKILFAFGCPKRELTMKLAELSTYDMEDEYGETDQV